MTTGNLSSSKTALDASLGPAAEGVGPGSGVSGKTVLFALWRGYGIRLLLQTDVVRTLVDSGARVVVLLPEDKLEEFKNAGLGPRVRFEKLDYEALRAAAKPALFRYGTSVLRITYNLKAVTRRRTTKLQVDRALLMEKSDGETRGERLRSRSILWLSYVLGYSKVLRLAFQQLMRLCFSGDFHDDVYQRHRPDLLVVATLGNSIDAFLLWEARRHSVPICSVLQSWDYPTTKGYGTCRPDHLVTWNQINKTEMVEYHDFRASEVFVGGVSHWDRYFHDPTPFDRAAYCERHGLDPDRKTIAYTAVNHKLFFHNLEVVADILKNIRDGYYGMPCQLLYRSHPSNFSMSGANWEQQKQRLTNASAELKEEYGDLLVEVTPPIEGSKRIFTFPGEDQAAIADLLRMSDVMVNVYSTMMIEACIFDLPVVNVSYAQYKDGLFNWSVYDEWDHIAPVMDSGAVRNAYESNELHGLIRAYLNDRSLDRDNRAELVNRLLPVNRGRAGREIGKHLYGLA